MRPGELVVARLSRGASVVRVLEVAADKTTVAMGRNKQARIPNDRIALATDVAVGDEREAEAFRREVEGLAATVDLADAWDLIADDEPAPLRADELAELYWGTAPSPAGRAALVLHLHNADDLFVYRDGTYAPRSRDEVRQRRQRQEREAEQAEETSSLLSGLTDGRLPSSLTSHQDSLLRLLQDYVVHGDELPRAGAARDLVATVAEGSTDLQRRGFELLVAAGVFSPDEALEVRRAGIPAAFPRDVIAEGQGLELAHALSGPARTDLTSVHTLTIDDEHTSDRDDALSVETEDTSVRLGIHIADAGALIPVGGPVDREADRRMATLYLPEGGIPMLPEHLVRSAGSLDPGETRAALSLLATLSDSGEVLDWNITPSVVRSDAALSYMDADRALEEDSDPFHSPLAALGQAARALRRGREEAGALIIERAELNVGVDESGRVELALRRSTPANELVSELMVLCNSLMAEFCRAEGIPAAFRSQPAPDLSDLPDAETPDAAPRSPQLQRYLMMRRLRPADIDVEPAPHAGLGVKVYIQATSPLRRYPDLVMQRQISHYLTAGTPLFSEEQIASVAQRAEVQIRELAGLEEARKRYWFLKYLQQTRLEQDAADGTLFEAVALDVPPGRSALLELADYPFRFRARLVAPSTPGQTVTVRLHGVDLWRRVGQWVHEPE